MSLLLVELVLQAMNLVPGDVRYSKMNIRNASNMVHTTKNYVYKFSTSPSGVRGSKTSLRKLPEVFRIAFVGDSFTFGLGVGDADTVPAQLEKELRKLGVTRTIEVLNFGVPGVGPIAYWEIVSKYVLEYQPDLVILGILNYNDLVDTNPITFRDEEKIASDIAGALPRKQPDPDNPEEDISRNWGLNSAVVRLSFRVYLRLVRKIDWKTYGTRWSGPKGNLIENPPADCRKALTTIKICEYDNYTKTFDGFQMSAFDIALNDGSIRRACDCEDNPYEIHNLIMGAGFAFHSNLLVPETRAAVLTNLDFVFEVIKRTIDEISSSGADTAIALFSTAFLVEPEHAPDILFGGLAPNLLLETTEISDQIAQRAERFGWPLFDPLALFREATADNSQLGPLYIPKDGHLTKRGSRLYARHMGEWMIEAELIEQRTRTTQ